MYTLNKFIVFVISLCLAGAFVLATEGGFSRNFDSELSVNTIMDEVMVLNSATEQEVAEIVSRVLIVRTRKGNVDLKSGAIHIDNNTVYIVSNNVVVEAIIPSGGGEVLVTAFYRESVASLSFQMTFVGD